MTPSTLFVCSLCRFSRKEPTQNGLSGGENLIQQLQAELQAKNLVSTIQIQPVRCMAACSDSCNVTLTAAEKITFVLSGLSPTESAPDLAKFCQQYAASADGKVPYQDRPDIIRESTAFVLPPLPVSSRLNQAN
jgi:predicted metal-binding protein